LHLSERKFESKKFLNTKYNYVYVWETKTANKKLFLRPH